MNPRAHRFKNRVLASLPFFEFSRFSRHLVPVALSPNNNLLDGKATHAYFLEEGVASVVVTLEEGNTVEVGVIGNDGVGEESPPVRWRCTVAQIDTSSRDPFLTLWMYYVPPCAFSSIIQLTMESPSTV
jgi:hypothetical protein